MISSQWTIDNKHLQEVKNEQQPEKSIKKSKKKTVSVNQPLTTLSLDFDSILKGIAASTTKSVTLSDQILKLDGLSYKEIYKSIIKGFNTPIAGTIQSSTAEETIDLCKQYGINPSDIQSISVFIDGSNVHKITFEKYVY